MKRTSAVVAGAMVIASAVVLAQGGQGQGGAPSAPVSLATGLQRAWATINANLTQALDVMPEENFTFQTTLADKTFGAQFGHVAKLSLQLVRGGEGRAEPESGQES